MAEKLETLLFASLAPVSRPFEKPSLPLHISLAPAFEIPQHRTDALAAALREKVAKFQIFKITGLENDMFGADHDIPVRKVGGSVLYAIHDEILPVITAFDENYNHPYVGEAYTPHVTYIGDRGLAENQRASIEELYLAQKGRNPERAENSLVVDRYALYAPSLLEPRRVI